MSETTRTVTRAGEGRWRCERTAEVSPAPAGWALLPPGDAMLTRRVKQAGPHWVVQERRGRRVLSRGVLAPADRIERLRRAVERERARPEYAHRLQASRERSQRQQADYVREFRQAVRDFLRFDPRYARVADALAEQVTDHTTPVGSGTVGRTRRVGVEERAAAAVIAWMRHQTTAYDQLEIPRVRGRRREVRRRLARRSHELLERFRRGEAIEPASCPLHRALGLGHARSEDPAAAPPPPSPGVRPAPRTLAPAPAERPAKPLWQTPLTRRR